MYLSRISLDYVSTLEHFVRWQSYIRPTMHCSYKILRDINTNFANWNTAHVTSVK
jgi:hypothetical protein